MPFLLETAGQDDAGALPDPHDYLADLAAFLRRRNGEDWLEDLDSRGGTWVNGVRLGEPRRLVDGDEIRFAGHHLRYRRPVSAAGDTDAPTGGGARFVVDLPPA